MSLCIFNPWHDMALAFGKQPFTPPAFTFDMYLKLGDIANLWNENVKDKSNISPWGWDYFTKQWLLKQGYSRALMPNDEDIDILRSLSHRHSFTSLLRELRQIRQTIGETRFFVELQRCSLDNLSGFVIKSPWSSSGRGVRLVTSENDVNWGKNIIQQQGGILVEPYYNKVKDFAMEFSWNNHKTSYLGLSLFRNQATTYMDNIICSEEYKIKLLSRYIEEDILEQIKHHIITWCDENFQALNIDTPFGVDMMIVEHDKTLMVHPCVELNLRRTMGYIALLLYEKIMSDDMHDSVHFKSIDIYNSDDFIGYFSINPKLGKWYVTCEKSEINN